MDNRPIKERLAEKGFIVTNKLFGGWDKGRRMITDKSGKERGFMSPLVALRKLTQTDPVYNCQLYKDKGCAHVDGYLCDFPNCSMNHEYIKQICEHKNYTVGHDNKTMLGYRVCLYCGEEF